MLPPISVLQTSTTPAAGTEIGILLFLAALVIVGIEAFTGIEITSRIGGGIRKVLGMLPIPFAGSSDDRGGGSDGLLSGMSTRTILAVGFALAVLAVASGRIVQLPQGGNVQILVVMELIAVYLVLREFDAFSIPVFMVITVATVVVALSALGESVMAALTMSPVWPILAAGLLYLGYKAIQAWRASNRPRYIRRPRR